ncbi:MAG: bidirectional hydrogenase complex protein HoxE [Chloroflexi bacterium]|nr:bidirectional hydrogenase complex protein HoxE [Chloroflexota bacterium]
MSTTTASSQAVRAGASGRAASDTRRRLIDAAMKRAHYRPDALIEVLHTAQETYGYLSEEMLLYVAARLRLPRSHVYGVATFYHMFSFKPLGEHTCTVCLGTACYVKRAAEIVAALEAELGVKPGQTTPDGRFSLSTARCIGSCGLAPVLVLDGTVIGRETPTQALADVRAALSRPPAVAQVAGRQTDDAG